MDAEVTLQGETMPVVVLTGLDAPDADALFTEVAQALRERGWVAPTFLEALRKREREFPTGLDFGRFHAALPHVDPEHVHTSALVVAVNRRPVTFQAMDNPARALSCRLAVFPMLRDATKQVPFLVAATGSLQQPGFYEQLSSAEDPEQVAALLRGALERANREEAG